jgi:fido (protein-threonine AMPylation protein)
MTAYAAIIHAHPFADGNGRTARTVYNLLLAKETGSRHFVPIQLICSRTQASFLIKLRRALYGGNWAGLQAFFADATRLSHRLQATLAAAAPADLRDPPAPAPAAEGLEGAEQSR